MNYLSRIQNAIDYIEANLDFDISSENIAQEACISHWHFQRIFKALTNETLKTYIRSRRLANAFEKLLITDLRIIEIAISAGFESQESFTRAFKKAFDMTPHIARKIADKNLFMKKIEFNNDYLRHINQNVSLEPEIITQSKRLFVGIKTRFFSVESDKNNIADKIPTLWNIFLPRIDEIPNGISGTAYGIIRQGTDKTGRLEYFAVREVSESGAIPNGMMSLELPKSTYAKFTHRGDIANLDNTVNYIYSSWLLRSGKRHNYGPDIEIYGAEYIANSDKSILYYAIPLAQEKV
ncbi:MAG: AraC family transcriptional regulator [Robiginitomaculum sp.]|nr:MAG: AraC family transcriptional regulator [Robiginitomaculum sp.]